MLKSKQMIRPGVLADLPQLTRIYNQSIASGYSTCDLSERSTLDRIRWFKQFSDRYPLWVYEDNSTILGYACLFRWSPKEGYKFTVEDAVYIHRDHQGKGLGKILLQHLLEFCEASGYRNIIARIFSKNPASINLHCSLGFEKVGHLKQVAYAKDQFEDVEIFSKLIQKSV